MAKVTEAHLEARRQQILDAAVACFAQMGFHETTMVDIARQAGLSTGLAYRYFSSKEEIIQATVIQSRSRIPLISEQLQGQVDFSDFVETLLRYMCTGLDSPGADVRWKVRLQAFALAARQPDEAETLRQARGEALDLFEQFVQRGQQSGNINPSLDARAIARVLIASFDGLALHWTADPDIDIWQTCEVVTALFNGSFKQQGRINSK